jgi:Cu(I)/Ag(I) efflux system membrane fusion protein
MKLVLNAPWRAVCAAAAVVALAVLTLPSWASGAINLEVVTPEITVGDATRLDIRVLDADSQPVTAPVTVTALRLDMGPDGMEAMTTRAVVVPTDQPGMVRIEADFTMAGRWSLTLTASVNGVERTGTVTLTAVKKAADATPAAPAAGERHIAYYRHPMGLPDTSPEPAKDEMGMDYIPVYEDEISGPAGSIRISPEKIQRAGIRTTLVKRQPMAQTVQGVGTIAVDERRMAMLSAKFEGFVEELYVGATGMPVQAGQKLARIWIASPEILQKEADYLSALKRGDADRAAANLRLFGISDAVIAELKRTGMPVRSIVLTAASSGVVLDKQAVPGMRFEPGEMLFMLADVSTVWVVAQIAERDLPLLAEGQTASIRLNADDGPAIEGTVSFINPMLSMATRTATVRIEVPNEDGVLKIGQYADVSIAAAAGDGKSLAIPESAVIDSGTRQVAFVAKEGGLFEPRDLVLGMRGNGMVEVRTGLSEGEQIVVSGNFLIDSESNLRAALAGVAPAAVSP